MNDTRTTAHDENAQIADLLRETAQLLEAQGANPFRVSAYRNAAAEIAAMPEGLRALFDDQGVAGLDALPRIGRGSPPRSPRWCSRVAGASSSACAATRTPRQLFRSVPGVGPGWRSASTRRLRRRDAGSAGAGRARRPARGRRGHRSATVGGDAAGGARHHAGAHARRPRSLARSGGGPDVGLLLAVDRSIARSGRGQPAKIAPQAVQSKRRSPGCRSCTPARPDGTSPRCSPTRRARTRLGRISDWVVIYFYDDAHAEGQRTVVTETRGPLAGRRVVRGREDECKAHYAGPDR